MALDPDKYAALILASGAGKPAVCEILEVIWAEGVTRYYGGSPWDQLMPFRSVPLRPIEPRLLYSSEKDPFSQFELQPDIRTQNINFTFDDLDREISNKFRQYGTVRCRLHYYYPDQDLFIESVWFGQLNAPQLYGWKRVQTTASNGWRSPEETVPNRAHPSHCPFIFGGRFTSLAALATNGCRYDRHLGGSNGLLNPATDEPFLDCPALTTADCTARWGDAKMYGGFTLKVPGYTSEPGWIARTYGNESILTKPIRVIAGTKHVSALPLLMFSRQPNSNHPELGFIRVVYEVGEGPNYDIRNLKVNSLAPNANQWVVRKGDLAQPVNGHPGLTENWSLTGNFHIAAIGLGNPVGISMQSLNGECDAHGNTETAVYTAEETFTRKWTNDRVWWLMACYENQRWGLGTDPAEFWIENFITTSAWGRKSVTFTRTFPDDESADYVHRRTTFNATLEPRPAAAQIADICRSGRLSVPFQREGKYDLAPFRAFTEDELEDAPVFRDHGAGSNIEWREGFEPSIQFSEIPTDQLTNEVKIVFEESINEDRDRPIFCDDKDLMAAAGRSRGSNQFFKVSKEYRAFGVNALFEAVKFGYSILWFGEFDEGGSKNNLRGVFKIPLEWAWNLRRYQAVKIESDLLTGLEWPEAVEPFEYFRLLYMNKIGNGLAELTVQAYNQDAYEAFEVESPAAPIEIGLPTWGGGGGGGGGPVCRPTFGDLEYDPHTMELRIPINPC